MHALNLTSRDLDDLLQLLFDRLRGKKDGLALAEPAVILLDAARGQGHGVYGIHLPHFTPIILDTFISGISDTFGYDAQQALVSLSADIPALSAEYLPEAFAAALGRIRAGLQAVDAVLDGREPPGDAQIAAVAPGIFHETAAGSTTLPFVSSFVTTGGPFTTARLIQPRVELRVTGEWSTRRRHEPAVTFSHIFADPDSPFERQIHAAIRLAERIAVRSHGAGPLSRLPRQYRVSLPEIAALPASSAGKMSGGSAGLAFAVLATGLIGRLELGRGVEPAAGTAFTGGVDDSGAVLPVEDSFIDRKMRAVFYSTCGRFVVPERNLPTAVAALSRLRQEHPRREIDLIPVRTVEEAFLDERIARRRLPNPGLAAMQRIFHWRKHLITGISTVAAAVIAAFILPDYLDRQVNSIELVENKLIMKNGADHLISEFDLDYSTPKSLSGANHRLLIRNIDGIEGAEAIALISETRDRNLGEENRLHLYLFSNRGELVRETDFSDVDIVKNVIAPSNILKGQFLLNHVVMDSDDDGVEEMFVLTHHSNFPPYSLIRFSLRDTTATAFIHNGQLRDIMPLDIDRDGHEELAVTGYNPTLDRAVLMIMDPKMIDGASPLHARISIPGHDRDIARYYIQLPDSPLLQRFDNPSLGLNCETINHGCFLSVFIKSRGKDILLDFDESLACTGALIYQIRQGVTRGDITKADRELADQSLYAGYIKDMISGVRYWDGEEWQPNPVANRTYERLRAEAMADAGDRRAL